MLKKHEISLMGGAKKALFHANLHSGGVQNSVFRVFPEIPPAHRGNREIGIWHSPKVSEFCNPYKIGGFSLNPIK